MSPTNVESDVLIIGRGLAGSIAALICEEAGLSVVLIHEKEAATSWAQGGIVYKAPDDPTELIKDVLKAGCYINHRPTVEKVVREGPALVESWLLEKLKVPFNRDANKYSLTREAAHGERRILHVNDETGFNILSLLEKQLSSRPNIIQYESTLIDLILSNRHAEDDQAVYSSSRVCGAYAWTPNIGVRTFKARATILASGGFASLFQYATGPSGSIGAGIAAAHRAGARSLHMEYVQFHPTALYAQGAPRCLVTEALRGEGAVIRNHKGETFVDSLAPRDVVSRAMHAEMIRTSQSHLFLDVSKVSNLDVKFPGFIKALKKFQLDPVNPLVPVLPATHYTLGGIWTDLNAKTNLSGLWACGEVACSGLHGANRLASMSLLEALVFGDQSGRSVVDFLKNDKEEIPKIRDWQESNENVDLTLVQQDWSMLRKTLWNYVGLIRSEKHLKRAERLLVDLRNEVESFYKNAKLSKELIDLRQGVLVATLCLYAAIRNRKSLGTHYLQEEF
jgi:L-aspartate oxidase